MDIYNHWWFIIFQHAYPIPLNVFYHILFIVFLFNIFFSFAAGYIIIFRRLKFKNYFIFTLNMAFVRRVGPSEEQPSVEMQSSRVQNPVQSSRVQKFKLSKPVSSLSCGPWNPTNLFWLFQQNFLAKPKQWVTGWEK